MTATRLLRTRLPPSKSSPNHITCPLSRLIRPFPADVRVWGSSLIEFKPRLSPLLVKKAAQIFDRRFRRVKTVSCGRTVAPNGIQLSCIRPQLAGGDVFIAAPPQSGKTLLYLLPEAIRQAYVRVNRDRDALGKTLVLVPTLDLVLLGSRSAAGVLRQGYNVQALYYKDVISRSHCDLVARSDVIYTTPQCALKAILASPTVFDDVRLLVLDEAQRLLKAQSAYTVMRLKAILQPNIQTVVLAARNDSALRQFVSRALRVEMKAISFCPEPDDSPVTRHFWGPQRSALFGEHKDLDIATNLQSVARSPLERKIQRTRSMVLEHCRSHEMYVDRGHRCEYVLHDPAQLSQMICSALMDGTKVVIFFPTVRMAQFCYVYFKHLVKVDRQLYALHGGLSPEKRRFTIDVFARRQNGVLFCTDLTSVGLNLGEVDRVIHVGAPDSMDIFADRVGLAKVGDERCKNLLLLHDLDAHVLYEAAELQCDIKPSEIKPVAILQSTSAVCWEDSICYRASCELMYRSLLGYYCNHAERLKFQRWQVPSLVYELLRSFGFTDTFSVTKQFASRLQLWDAPGLIIDNKSVRKTDLQAAAAGYPGFRSRAMQTGVPDIDDMVHR